MKTRTAPTFSDYESLVQASGITPNFWMAESYWKAANWSLASNESGVIWPQDAALERMLPAMESAGTAAWPCWAGWPGPWPDRAGTFLDHQIIYDPKSFADLSGHDRAVFRKNTRHFERMNAGIVYRPIEEGDSPPALLAEWLKEDQEIYDIDVIVDYLTLLDPQYAAVLEVEGSPIGLNVWDENYRFINFRYSFVNRRVKYASEYIRLRFYRDMLERSEKMVNDGGNLDNQRLLAFKMKLKPIVVQNVYSWFRP